MEVIDLTKFSGDSEDESDLDWKQGQVQWQDENESTLDCSKQGDGSFQRVSLLCSTDSEW